MKLTLAIAALALVAGIAAGVIGTRLLTPTRQLRLAPSNMSAVLDRLDLTDQQRSQAAAILDRSAPRSRAIMMDMAQQLRRVADSVDAELRAILTEAQRARLDSLREEPRFLLRRVMVTPDGVRHDTILDTSPPLPRGERRPRTP